MSKIRQSSKLFLLRNNFSQTRARPQQQTAGSAPNPLLPSVGGASENLATSNFTNFSTKVIIKLKTRTRKNKMAIPLLLQVGAIPFTNESLASRRRQNLTLSQHQRQIIGQLMTEAAEAIQEVIRSPQTSEVCVNTDLTVPPNSPNTQQTFEFPATETETSTSEEEDQRPPRPQRKRRRPPSFKKHRVSPKKVVQDDADDEATDEDLKENLELKLKLGLLAETSSSEAEESGPEKWSKIGQELRFIADKMCDDDNGTQIQPFQPQDLLSLINLLLPFSVPQSLWSALLSYAAWKIFKKFQ